MKTSKTLRGFTIMHFKDANSNECTVQESSAMRKEALIWLGATDLDVQVMTSCGWKKLDIKDLPDVKDYVSNNRMHLTQSNVKELLPVLEYFAEHGVLPFTE